MRNVCRTTSAHGRAAHGLGGALVVAVVALITGCGADPPRTDDDAWLGLGEAPREAAHGETDERLHLLVYRLTVAVDAPLAAARDAATVHEDEAQARWASNGMTAAVVTRARWDTFEAALPPISGRRTMRTPITDSLTPIHDGAPLRDATAITIALGEAGRWRETLAPGQPRLLAQIERRPDEGINIAIVPQHHVPRHTLRVRSVAEQMLDGLVLHQLRLERTLSPGDVLVIMRTPRPPPPAPSRNEDREADDESAALEQPTSDGAEATDDTDPPSDAHEPTRPLDEQVAAAGLTPVDDLGRLLLEGRRIGRHYSVILLITAQWPGDSTADDEP